MDALTFEQWVLFLAVTFRNQYRAVARQSLPEADARLPLVRAGRLTVAQVNSGEAVHFLYTATREPEATVCRALTVEPPAGLSVPDWALLHAEAYKRFVERSLGCEPVGHFVLFPGQDDAYATVLLEAERIAREHVAALGP